MGGWVLSCMAVIDGGGVTQKINNTRHACHMPKGAQEVYGFYMMGVYVIEAAFSCQVHQDPRGKPERAADWG